jgi:hypothetical protein
MPSRAKRYHQNGSCHGLLLLAIPQAATLPCIDYTNDAPFMVDGEREVPSFVTQEVLHFIGEAAHVGLVKLVFDFALFYVADGMGQCRICKLGWR